MTTVILSGHDANMAELAGLCLPSKLRFSEAIGAPLRVMTPEFYEDFPDEHPSFTKLRIIKKHMEEFERVIWLDADSIITNPEAFPHIRDEACLTVSMDYPIEDQRPKFNNWSAGNMVWNSNFWSIQFIQISLDFVMYKNRPYWDQNAMQHTLTKIPSYRPFIDILDPNKLNAVHPEVGSIQAAKWQKGDFLVHLTGMTHASREVIARLNYSEYL